MIRRTVAPRPQSTENNLNRVRLPKLSRVKLDGSTRASDPVEFASRRLGNSKKGKHMFDTSSKRLLVGCAMVSFITLLAIFGLAQEPQKTNVLDERAEKMLSELLSTHDQLVQAEWAMYEGGKISIEDVTSTEIELTKVKLELSKTHEQRIEAREYLVSKARTLEQIVHEKFKFGQSSVADDLKARALRQRAELELHREQAGQIR